ncbi:MAG: FAD-dependent oxidoreductase [Polyangiaceae bacterium]
MEAIRHLIVGAGVTGLATAAFLRDDDYLVLEADREIGGYCKTVKQDGFVWDYSGHFFHFKHPEIESWLRERMVGQEVRTINKRSFISYGGKLVDFPFQKNIHQLPQNEFIDCLHDLYFARYPGAAQVKSTNFKAILYARFGRGIAEKFLIPYTEKLYACDLGTLDEDAMGRFFPHADLTDIVRNMRAPDNASYNATFSYPRGGAIEYIKALASAVRPGGIATEEKLVSIDLQRRVARTSKREIQFERLVSSAPFPSIVRAAGLAHDPSIFTWNKVLVFNLGFDKKGPKDAHWIYYPDRARSFYRVGFYDNIFDTDRMSLYIEIGYARDAAIDVEAARKRVLDDLRAEGVATDHKLVSSHSIVMDPAYVHITRQSLAEHRRLSRILNAHGVYPAGRYGGWTYCSIEDNILEAKSLVSAFEPA